MLESQLRNQSIYLMYFFKVRFLIRIGDDVHKWFNFYWNTADIFNAIDFQKSLINRWETLEAGFVLEFFTDLQRFFQKLSIFLDSLVDGGNLIFEGLYFFNSIEFILPFFFYSSHNYLTDCILFPHPSNYRMHLFINTPHLFEAFQYLQNQLFSAANLLFVL